MAALEPDNDTARQISQLVYCNSTPKSVLIVHSDSTVCNNILQLLVQYCSGTSTTIQDCTVQDLHTVTLADYQLIIALQVDVNMATKINTLARDSLTPFLYCQLVPGYCAVFCDMVEQGRPHLPADGLGVHVGAVSPGEVGGTSVVTCDRVHCLEMQEAVLIGEVDGVVVEVISEKELLVKHGEEEIKQGDTVLHSETSDTTDTARSLSECLNTNDRLHRLLCLHAGQGGAPCGEEHSQAPLPTVMCCAGLITATILDIVTKSFTPVNSLQFHPLPTHTTQDSIKQMEEQSVLVFGCSELTVQLVKVLVFVRVKMVTVLCQTEEMVRRMEKVAESLSDRVTKIVIDKFSSTSESLCSSVCCVVCAGGTIEERLVVHGWGVHHTRPGLDLAVQGRVGHVETFVPHHTISYPCTPSSSDQEPPFCVTKSFPHMPEHATVWAKHKITNLLFDKPNICKQFLTDYKVFPDRSVDSQMCPPPGYVVSCKMLAMFGHNPSVEKCIQIARIKFEKYFSGKALQLQANFNKNSTTSSGGLFWSWPKLFPRPVVFTAKNPEHLEFVKLLALGLASTLGLNEEVDDEKLLSILQSVEVPPFVPKNKEIITDESVTADDTTKDPAETVLESMTSLLDTTTIHVGQADIPTSMVTRMCVLASHLRCDMYNIPRATEQQLMYFMGYLDPCLAPTISQVVGLGLSELVRICTTNVSTSSSSCNTSPTNWWVGPGLVIPAAAVKPPVTRLSPGLSVTLWDKLEVQGNTTTTLQNFLDIMQQKYQLEVTMVVQDSRMVYVPFMPGHKARLPKLMSSLVKNLDISGAVTLSVTAASAGEEEDMTIPPVRYLLG